MLLIFSDDWGRHPSSCQHLVGHLLARHKVAWVNTIGMRPPRLDLATVRRGWEKLGQWTRPKGQVQTASYNPVVVSPRMWPWFRRSHDRWLNQKLLMKTLLPLVVSAGEPVHAVTTIPIVADLIGKLPVHRWTYYCVDDFSAWPGLDQATMGRMEQQLVEGCDEVIAVSDFLVTRLAEQNCFAKLLTHGVDLAFWQNPSVAPDLAAAFQHLERPLALFWGVVDQRMNASWINRLANSMQQGTVVLVGPLDNPESALLRNHRVVHFPALPFKQLPQLAALADALIMPYADLPVTRAMQPLKLKEYLATGKPVVVSSLPSALPWSDCLDIAKTAEQFVALVVERLRSGIPATQIAARRRLAAESWAAKASQFEAWITAASEASHAKEADGTNAPCTQI
jgi:glycosyltransferase involved in cell wall biosynthesis